MPNRTFFWFILPAMTAMILLIALPIVSVLIQSVHIQHEQVLVLSESCDPFGCTMVTSIDTEATAKLREEKPLGRFIGLDTYPDRAHLAIDEVSKAWTSSDSMGAFFNRVLNLPLYKALAFTITYTVFVTPLVILFGLAVAVGVNNLPKIVKGPTVFISLLPMIITPLVGSIILFWMVDGDGIIGAMLQRIFEDNSLSLKASPKLTWIMLIVYGVWHHLPFSFIVFYAGLQTVSEDTMEAAMIDGASRWQRMINVVVPHLMPLVIFLLLIQLMDNFRVFEPIIGFSAEAHATSLSWIIYNALRESGSPLFSSAGATSMITIIGVVILLVPLLVHTYRGYSQKAN